MERPLTHQIRPQPPSSSGVTDREEVTLALTDFINTRIMARSRPVQPDDDLEAAGVDSMALLKILLFVEAEFGFWMPDEDLVPENLRSPRELAHYICRRRQGP